MDEWEEGDTEEKMYRRLRPQTLPRASPWLRRVPHPTNRREDPDTVWTTTEHPIPEWDPEWDTMMLVCNDYVAQADNELTVP